MGEGAIKVYQNLISVTLQYPVTAITLIILQTIDDIQNVFSEQFLEISWFVLCILLYKIYIIT